MKSISDNYHASNDGAHETFADLLFCALVVLILFVLALTIEVSQRVRSARAASEPVQEISAEELVKLTPEEMERLSQQLRQQQVELVQLRSQMSANAAQVRNQLAALAGEQRFTGAREPAALCIAYNYDSNRYYFIPSKDVDHADRSFSGESVFEHSLRKRRELADVALAARKQRGFKLSEIQAVYRSLSRYRRVIPTESSYTVESDEIGLYYHVLLCEYIAGDVTTEIDHEPVVVDAIGKIKEVVGPDSEEMFPTCLVSVNEANQQLTLGGVVLQPRDLRAILLSVDGRGLLLDFEGYDGPPPTWLYEQVLAPAGYIAKTPKVP